MAESFPAPVHSPTRVPADWIRVGLLADVERRGIVAVAGPSCRIAVVVDAGRVHAVDNRCPHMGFPLDRGTVKDGILTCHWHQARFDLSSGCTFDLWADDVPRYDARVVEGCVYVSPRPRRAQDAAHFRHRLRRGIEQNVPLVQAKSLLGLLERGAELDEIVRGVALYASRNLADFGEGMVRLACVANLYPMLSEETRYQALLYAVRRIGADTSRAVPRREREALSGGDHDRATLERWLRQWVQTRHRDAAERTLLTGIPGSDPERYAALLFGAASERLFANTGHVLDACNKALELCELLGWETAEELVPLLVPGLVATRGEEENTSWHHPVQIVAPLRAVEAELPALLVQGAASGAGWQGGSALSALLLGDDPLAIVAGLREALAAGAAPEEVARRVAHAAGLRLARFATSNEVTDWFDTQHSMNFANAVHQAVVRDPAPGTVRAIFQAAIAVYQNRYLNVPPARLPSERGRLETLPREPDVIRAQLLERLDQRAEIDAVADLVSRWLSLGLPREDLVDTLVFGAVREDIDFHALQVIEASARQCAAWGTGPEIEHLLVGAARSLAAQCPTRRAGQQTARIALRLHRGDAVFEAEA